VNSEPNEQKKTAAPQEPAMPRVTGMNSSRPSSPPREPRPTEPAGSSLVHPTESAVGVPATGVPWWQTAKDCGCWTDKSDGDMGYVHFGSTEALRVFVTKICAQAYRAGLAAVPSVVNKFGDRLRPEMQRFFAGSHEHLLSEALRSDEQKKTAAPQEPAEPVAWRDHVEQRLLTWRQRFVNKSGDQLALDDFMDMESLSDLLDFVLDEYVGPAQSVADAQDAVRDALLQVIQRLNSSPYSLTKAECISEVEKMRAAMALDVTNSDPKG
jgi:hypothetical protein